MRNHRTILVTGGAGFIGLNLIQYFLGNHPHYHIINLDKLTYAANMTELEKLKAHSNYQFIKGDINDRALLEQLFSDHGITDVIHLAAESHVDRSIEAPDVFIQTNVHGTFTLLDVAKKHWLDMRNDQKCRFHHISTDEVYGSLGQDGFFTEHTAYAPNSPYSASKAASDFLVRSYFHTYGLNTVTTNCSNNYGPRQHSEKLIPTIIRKAVKLERIPIYGDGKNIRDWLFVLDHCRGIDLAFHKGKAGETYNIGGKNEHTNIEIATTLCGILDEIAPEYKKGTRISSYKELISFVSDRPGHDRRYAIDASRIEHELGWKAEEGFESGLRKTVEWYIHENQQSKPT
ncbi:MAG TPA: dTDP-glucose 4,6-dehydratase [Bacillales bacterium]|nr:dTDP-glucose 4,6-dehydratase [Bacillales bacterium]